MQVVKWFLFEGQGVGHVVYRKSWVVGESCGLVNMLVKWSVLEGDDVICFGVG